MHRTACFSGALLLLSIAAGCSSSPLTGQRTAMVTSGVAIEQGADGRFVSPQRIPHTFVLTNESRDPVTIVGSRIRIDTTAQFADTHAWALPRTVAPGESVAVIVTAVVRQAEHLSWVELQLEDGETVRLELAVDAGQLALPAHTPVTLHSARRGEAVDG